MKKSSSLSALAFRKFRRNIWGMFSFFFIIICVFVAIFAYVLAPDNSKNANQMHLEIHSQNPGFKVQMLEIPSPISDQSRLGSMFFGKENPDSQIPIASYKVVKDGIEISEYTSDGTPGLLKFYPITLFKGAVKAEDIPSMFIKNRNFYLGTDKYGRDMLSRWIIGMRVSLAIGFIAVLISLVLGISLGAIAGYFGGRTDAFIMWLINVTWSIPTLLLVIAITLALGKGFWQVFVAVGLTMWVEVARVVRGQVLSVKRMQFVTAAKALGFTNGRIIIRHILPNSLAPVIIISAANFASAILVESGLSFLGIGAQPPMPSWGGIIKDHYAHIILGKPLLALIPGFAIMSLVTAFMLMGNALRDALDVRNNPV